MTAFLALKKGPISFLSSGLQFIWQLLTKNNFLDLSKKEISIRIVPYQDERVICLTPEGRKIG